MSRRASDGEGEDDSEEEEEVEEGEEQEEGSESEDEAESEDEGESSEEDESEKSEAESAASSSSDEEESIMKKWKRYEKEKQARREAGEEVEEPKLDYSSDDDDLDTLTAKLMMSLWAFRRMSEDDQKTVLWSGQTPEFQKLVLQIFNGWTKEDVEKLEKLEEQRKLENEILKLRLQRKALPKKYRKLWQQMKTKKLVDDVQELSLDQLTRSQRQAMKSLLVQLASGERYEKVAKRNVPTEKEFPTPSWYKSSKAYAAHVLDVMMTKMRNRGLFDYINRMKDVWLEELSPYDREIMEERYRYDRMRKALREWRLWDFDMEALKWLWSRTSLLDKILHSPWLGQIAMGISAIYSYSLLLNSSFPSPFKPMASIAIAAVGATSITGLASTIEEKIIRPMQFPWKTEKDPYWWDEWHNWIMVHVWAFFVPLVSPGFGWEPWSKIRNYYLLLWLSDTISEAQLPWDLFGEIDFRFPLWWPGAHYEFPMNFVDYPVPNFAMLCIMSSALNAIFRYPHKLEGIYTIIGAFLFVLGSHFLLWLTTNRHTYPTEGIHFNHDAEIFYKRQVRGLITADIRPYGYWLVAASLPFLALGLPAISVIDFTDPTLARLNPLDWIRRLILSYHLDWWTIVKTFFSREDFKSVPDAYAVFRNAWMGVGPVPPNLEYQWDDTEDIERDIELARERIWGDIYDESVGEPNGDHVQFANLDDQSSLDHERVASDFEGRWAPLWELDEEQNPDGKNFMVLDYNPRQLRSLMEEVAEEGGDDAGWVTDELYGKTHEEKEH